jgi:site-specific DNA-methyltransferase (adenine-specific)/adenine-specific DNA-methyltransferase
VADFFCGSGTTATVAARLGRRWLACDHTPLAISTTYRRLLLEEAVGAFTVWRAGETVKSPALEPLIQVQPSDSKIIVKLVDVAREPPSETSFPENINLWEIDWDYDESVFRSRSQVVRGWQQEEINLKLSNTYSPLGRFLISIRVFDTQGWSGNTTYDITLPNP